MPFQAPRGGCWVPEEDALHGTLFDAQSGTFVARPARFFRGGQFLPPNVTHIAIMYSLVSYDGGLSSPGTVAVYSKQSTVPIYGATDHEGQPVYIGRPVMLIVPVGSTAEFINNERLRLWQDIQDALHGS
jgi:hypothetical protein